MKKEAMNLKSTKEEYIGGGRLKEEKKEEMIKLYYLNFL